MPKILILEDNQPLAEALSESLADHAVDVVAKGNDALEYLRANQYDLLVLDWQVPGVSGVDVCRQYRASGGQAGVLMLTGMNALSNKMEGLDSGADDYLTKPFEMGEFLARVRAQLRRTGKQVIDDVLTAGAIRLDRIRRIVTRDGNELKLQPHEFQILEFFMRHPGEVVETNTLLERVWSTDAEVSSEAVYTAMNRLRKKIDPDNKDALIKTIFGVGYRLAP